MENFEFCNPAHIVFGRDEERRTGELIRLHGGSRVLFLYGGGSIRRSGLYDRVVDSLHRENLFFLELGGVKPNPRLSLVREGIRLCRENQVDFILAVGGGSVIDTAKTVAAGLRCPGDIWDYFMDLSKPLAGALPVGVVLTIPATGSESSDSAVITNEENALKRHIAGNCLVPAFAVLDPQITFTMPQYQIACGCSDILSHMMERYFTRSEHVDLTDRLLEGAMRSLLIQAPLAMKEPGDYNCRAELMWTGTIAHNNLLGTGRIGDWASHSIEHELSAAYDLAHGAGLSIVTPAWMKYVWSTAPAKFLQFAERVFDLPCATGEPEPVISAMIARLEAWYESLGLPVRLAQAGIDAARLEEMADRCLLGRESVGNLRPLYRDDVLKIYQLALN